MYHCPACNREYDVDPDPDGLICEDCYDGVTECTLIPEDDLFSRHPRRSRYVPQFAYFRCPNCHSTMLLASEYSELICPICYAATGATDETTH